MPPQHSASSTVCCASTIALILLLGEIMPSCSCYEEKKLVYIAIATLLGAQPSSCSKYTLSRDTPVTPYTRPPVFTDSTTRDRPRDGNLTAICGNLTAICHIPPNSAIFHRIPPSS